MAAGVAGLVLVAMLDLRGCLGYAGDELRRYDSRRFTVLAVVDARTLEVDAPDGRRAATRVRLWGVGIPQPTTKRTDSPSSPASSVAAEDPPPAAVALQRVRDLAQGRVVRLHLQPYRLRDRGGRLLAFVELPDGSRLGPTLLREGLAVVDDRWPHDDLERYEQLEREARDQQRGVWAQANHSADHP